MPNIIGSQVCVLLILTAVNPDGDHHQWVSIFRLKITILSETSVSFVSLSGLDQNLNGRP